MKRRLCAAVVGLLIACVAGAVDAQRRPLLITSAESTGKPVYRTLWTTARKWDEPALLKLSASPNPYERQYAVMQLGEQAEVSDVALVRVQNALGDQAEIVRLQAAASLVRLGPRAHRSLISALEDERALGPFAYFSEQRNSTQERNLSIADLAFAVLHRADKVNTADIVAAYLRTAQKHRSTEPVSAADEGRFGIVKGTEVVRRTPPQRLLLLLTERIPSAASALLPLLNGTDLEARWAALLALQNARELPVALAAPLDRVLRQGDAAFARLAARALGRASRAALEAATRAESSRTRAAAMAGVDHHSRGFADIVSRALDDPSADVRLAALRRAAILEPEDTWNQRLSCAELRDARAPAAAVVRREAYKSLTATLFAEMLGQGHKRGTTTLDPLAVLGPAVRHIACVRPELAPIAIAAFTPLLKSPDPGRQLLAIETLGDLGTDGHVVPIDDWIPDAMALLIESQQNRSRLAAVTTLIGYGTIRPESAAAIVAAYQRFVEQDATAANELSSALVGRTDTLRRINSEFTALTVRRGLRNDVEAALLLGGLGRGAPLPQPVRQALAGWNEEAQIGLLKLLASRVHDDNVIMDGLDRVVRSSAASKYDRRDLAQALVQAGAAGVSRLLAIARDSTLPSAVRASAAESLGEFGSTHPETPAVLDELAVLSDPIVKEAALDAFAEPTYQGSVPDQIVAAAQAGLRHASPSIREASARVYRRLKRPVGPELDVLVHDPSTEVRVAAMQLIPLLADDDPRVPALLGAGLNDKEGWVRRKALEAVAASGRAGARVLDAYFAGGGKPDEEVTAAVGALGAHAAPLVRHLVEWLPRLETKTDGYQWSDRSHVARVLGRLARHVPEARTAAMELAATGSEIERHVAAEALVNHGVDWQREPVLATVLLDGAIRVHMTALLARVLDLLYPYWGGVSVSGGGGSLPTFPWPPPAGHKWVTVPRQLPGVNVKTLGELYDSLVAALVKASPGFETGLFAGVPNGFALIARMERIQDNGAPYPGDKRWVTQGVPFLSLSEFLGNLFFEKPGYFRVIAFVVTDDVNFTADQNTTLPSVELGGRQMRAEMRERPFETQTLLALIYTFERKPGAEITSWPNAAPSGLQHLTAAGIMSALQAR